MSATMLRTPVLVVGAGVAGALLALELAHHDVPSIVVERAPRPSRHPDLLLVSGRSMELLRRLGLAETVRERAVDPDRPTDIVWSQGLDRPPVLVSRIPSANELRRRYATTTDGHAPIEPYLLTSGPELTARLRDALLDHPIIDVRPGWTLTGVRSERHGTVASVIEAGGGRHAVEAQYVAGCDGAQSTVRRCIGVAMEPLDPAPQHYTVYFRCPELTRRSVHPAAVIAGGGTLFWGHDGDVCIAHLPLTAGEPTVTDPATVLQDLLGVVREPPRILGVVQREDEFGVARSYRRGRVFLAGDSAHRFDPPGGNVDTCIGDAVDLGWKLAASIKGWGGAGLLASYETERRRRALLDRELARRTLQTRLRFGRLVSAGAGPRFLADVLSQEAPQIELTGTGPAGGHAGSPVVWQESADPSCRPATAPGSRPPALRLRDGAQLFDLFGTQFTLVDLTGHGDGKPLVSSAEARRIPMTHLTVADDAVRAGWASRLVLVRPDQQIAWRADHPPADWNTVLDVVTGHHPQEYVNA